MHCKWKVVFVEEDWAFRCYIRWLLRQTARALEPRIRWRFRWPMFPVLPPPQEEIERWINRGT